MSSATTRNFLIGVVGALGLLAALSSCRKEDPFAIANEGDVVAQDPGVLEPETQPGWKAILTLPGTDYEIPVDIEQKKDGAFVTFRLISHGQEIEVERYRSSDQKFELVQAASERFEPPLPLLEYPVRKGLQPPWRGQLIIGELAKEAEAKIEIKTEPLKAKGYQENALKVTVDLAIDGGAPNPAQRTLEFWFVPKKGLLKREFDKGSTRNPAPPGVPSEGKAD